MKFSSGQSDISENGICGVRHLSPVGYLDMMFLCENYTIRVDRQQFGCLFLILKSITLLFMEEK